VPVVFVGLLFGQLFVARSRVAASFQWWRVRQRELSAVFVLFVCAEEGATDVDGSERYLHPTTHRTSYTFATIIQGTRAVVYVDRQNGPTRHASKGIEEM
jgi:hypothetical protein